MRSWLYVMSAPATTAWAEWPVMLCAQGEVQQLSLGGLRERVGTQRLLVIVPVEWATWCRGEALAGRGRASRASQCFALEEQLSSDLDTLHLALAPLDKQRRASGWALERARFTAFWAALGEAGVQVTRMVVDADLLPLQSTQAQWLCGRWILGGSLEARLALDDQQRRAWAGQLAPGFDWPQPSTPSHDEQALAAMVERAPGATDLCQAGFRAHRSRIAWQAIAGCALVLALMPSGLDLYRAQVLGQAAERLDQASVQVYAQGYGQTLPVTALASRLQAMQVAHQRQQGRLLPRLQQLSSVVVNDQLAQVSGLEFEQGKWRLEVTARGFADLDELQRRWQAQGFAVQVGSARKSEQGVQVQIVLKG